MSLSGSEKEEEPVVEEKEDGPVVEEKNGNEEKNGKAEEEKIEVDEESKEAEETKESTEDAGVKRKVDEVIKDAEADSNVSPKKAKLDDEKEAEVEEKTAEASA